MGIDFQEHERTGKPRIGWLMLLLLPFTSAAARPDHADFLTTDAAITRIVDGKPWTAVAADGVRAKLTLFPDGTGTFEGPLTMSAAWYAEAGTFCVRIRMAGTKCLRFRQVGGKLEGYAGSTLDLTLSR